MDQKELSDHFTITVNGEEREIFMSYNLLRELVKICTSIEATIAIAVDEELHDAVVGALLAERSKSGRITQAVDLLDLELDAEEVMGLIAWAQDHALDFFAKALLRGQAVVQRHEASLEALTSSRGGSPASPPTTPSAGPSTPSPAG